MQNVLRVKAIKTTLNIYTDVTLEVKQREFDNLQKKVAKGNDMPENYEKAVKADGNPV